MSDKNISVDNVQGLKYRYSVWLRIVLILAVLAPYTFSFGGVGTSLMLINRTKYFIHIVIGNETYTYIPPGGVVNHKVIAPAVIFVDVTYAPGQGVEGEATKSFEFTVQTQTTSQTQNSNDCSSTGNANTCSKERTVSSSSSSSSSAGRWDIYPSDLTSIKTPE